MTLSDGESVSVLPLWIAVWQTLKGGLARCGPSAEHGSITDAYCNACRGMYTHERLSITKHLLKGISEAKSKGCMKILYLQTLESLSRVVAQLEADPQRFPYIASPQERSSDCPETLMKAGFSLCRLHESNVPLSEEVVEHLEAELEPFCYTAGLTYDRCDEAVGHWRNFFIGVVGAVDAQEEDVLWPNQARLSLVARMFPIKAPPCACLTLMITNRRGSSQLESDSCGKA